MIRRYHHGSNLDLVLLLQRQFDLVVAGLHGHGGQRVPVARCLRACSCTSRWHPLHAPADLTPDLATVHLFLSPRFAE